MKTISKEAQDNITPLMALKLLKEGNQRFVSNLKMNRNLLSQMNETSEAQHPFAVIISCMDSRTSAELIFDQGLGDVFSIRIAGNVINEDILGSTEFGCKVAGAKIVVVLGHTGCGAIKGAIANVDLGHLHFITHKIQRVIPQIKNNFPKASEVDFCNHVTKDNVLQGITDLKSRSSILEEMNYKGEIKIIGGLYDLSSGEVTFYDIENQL
jgi:carbonic anhydrase